MRAVSCSTGGETAGDPLLLQRELRFVWVNADTDAGALPTPVLSRFGCEGLWNSQHELAALCTVRWDFPAFGSAFR